MDTNQGIEEISRRRFLVIAAMGVAAANDRMIATAEELDMAKKIGAFDNRFENRPCSDAVRAEKSRLSYYGGV